MQETQTFGCVSGNHHTGLETQLTGGVIERWIEVMYAKQVVLQELQASFEIVESETGRPVKRVMVVVRMNRPKMRTG